MTHESEENADKQHAEEGDGKHHAEPDRCRELQEAMGVVSG